MPQVCVLLQNQKAQRGSLLLGWTEFLVSGTNTTVFHCGKLLRSVFFFYSLTVILDAMLVFLWNPPTHCTCSQPGQTEK